MNHYFRHWLWFSATCLSLYVIGIAGCIHVQGSLNDPYTSVQIVRNVGDIGVVLGEDQGKNITAAQIILFEEGSVVTESVELATFDFEVAEINIEPIGQSVFSLKLEDKGRPKEWLSSVLSGEERMPYVIENPGLWLSISSIFVFIAGTVVLIVYSSAMKRKK